MYRYVMPVNPASCFPGQTSLKICCVEEQQHVRAASPHSMQLEHREMDVCTYQVFYLHGELKKANLEGCRGEKGTL